MTVQTLLAAAGLLLVVAITPGPNNLIVLRAAAKGGMRAAIRMIGGVVVGSLLLLALVLAGSAEAFSHWPALRKLIAAGGMAYLIWLGIGLIRPHSSNDDDPALPAGLCGLIGFQFLNPKSWVLVLSMVAALHALSARAIFAYLAPAFVVIPSACLMLWALAGSRLTKWLNDELLRQRMDRILGVLIVVSAIFLFI